MKKTNEKEHELNKTALLLIINYVHVRGWNMHGSDCAIVTLIIRLISSGVN